MTVSLVTANERVNLELNVSRIREDGSQFEAISTLGTTGYEALTFARNAALDLQTGVHLFTIAAITPNRPVTGTILVTLESGDEYTGTSLYSGRPVARLLPERDGPTLYAADFGFRFEVPENATRLKVRARTTFNARTLDIDLFLRLDEEPDIINGQVRSTYEASGLSGDEMIEVTTDDVFRPLQPGTYFAAIVVWNTLDLVEVRLDLEIETTDPAPAPASLEVSQQSLTFGGESDPDLTPQVVEVSNGGDGPLGFVIESNQEWLVPSAFGATTDGVVTFDANSEVTPLELSPESPAQGAEFFPLLVSIDTEGLEEGTYTGELSLIGPPATTQVIPVTANVAAPGPEGPTISQGGVVNGADFSAAFAPGSIISVFGREFATENTAAASVPLPAELGGGNVTVTAGDSTLPAPLYFASPGQINAQLPYGLAAGAVELQVTNANGTSETATLAITETAPRVFTLDGGTGTAIALKPDNSLIGEANPLEPGGVAVLYLIGLGEVMPPLAAGEGAGGGAAAGPINVVSGVTVTVGGQPAEVLFQGLTPYLVGLYQVNVRLAEDVTAGDPAVVVTLGGVSSQDGVTLPVMAP